MLAAVQLQSVPVQYSEAVTPAKVVNRQLAVKLSTTETRLVEILAEMQHDTSDIATIVQDLRYRQARSQFQRRLGRPLSEREEVQLRRRALAGAVADQWLDELCDGR